VVNPAPPSVKQLRYLKVLCADTGTPYLPPLTSQEASTQITLLKREQKIRRKEPA